MIVANATDAPAEEMARASRVSPMLSNYLFSALAGTTWFFQFFFYTMGETQMGRFRFSSWTLHMASIIIFSTLWGIGLKEWNGTSARTKRMVALSLFVLTASTVVVGRELSRHARHSNPGGNAPVAQLERASAF